MIKDLSVLAIIPARGGSKGIPGKNIKPLNGKPLISYTIEAALKSKFIDKVMVSSDDDGILMVSKAAGAEVPFKRPAELGLDTTPGIDPILHAINWHETNDRKYDVIICLQCTSPFRTEEHIDQALEEMVDGGANSIVSVCETEVSPYWMKLIEDGKLKDFITDAPFYSRRQDVPTIYRLNGAIYAAMTEVLVSKGNWYTEQTLAYVMDRGSSIDIDDTLDFKFAELLMKESKNE